jgi:alpha-beta hydrolase superfamily lysophospholipase
MRRRKHGWLVLLAVAAAGGIGCASPPYTPPRAPQASAQIPPEVVYQKGHFVGGGGLKLFEQSWRPDKPPRAVVVLVHGLKDHSSRYRDLGIHLAYRGLAVYGFDLRGHGYSEGVRDHIDSLDNAVTDLEALMTLVRDRQPGKPIYLVGQGFGASLAAVYGARKAGSKMPLAGLVLSAPPLRGEVKRSERMGTRAAAIFGPRTHQLEIDLTKWSSDPSVVAAWRTDPLVYDGQPTASTAGEVLRASDELQRSAGELKLPLLVMFGSADVVASADQGKALVEHAGSTDKNFQMYEGLFHDLFREPRRSEVIGDVLTWLNNHAGQFAEEQAKAQAEAQAKAQAEAAKLAPPPASAQATPAAKKGKKK